MGAKTITVKIVKPTPPKGVNITTMANEQYTYTTAAIDEVLNRPGVTANITFDDDTKKITDAMFIMYNPDALKLAEKIDAAKTKSDTLLKQNGMAVKSAPVISTPVKQTPVKPP